MAGPGWNQEVHPDLPHECSARELELSFTASPGSLVEIWIRSGTAKTAQHSYGMRVSESSSSGLTSYATALMAFFFPPKYFLVI